MDTDKPYPVRKEYCIIEAKSRFDDNVLLEFEDGKLDHGNIIATMQPKNDISDRLKEYTHINFINSAKDGNKPIDKVFEDHIRTYYPEFYKNHEFIYASIFPEETPDFKLKDEVIKDTIIRSYIGHWRNKITCTTSPYVLLKATSFDIRYIAKAPNMKIHENPDIAIISKAPKVDYRGKDMSVVIIKDDTYNENICIDTDDYCVRHVNNDYYIVYGFGDYDINESYIIYSNKCDIKYLAENCREDISKTIYKQVIRDYTTLYGNIRNPINNDNIKYVI